MTIISDFKEIKSSSECQNLFIYNFLFNFLQIINIINLLFITFVYEFLFLLKWYFKLQLN